MSKTEVELCCLLLKENFGEPSQLVGKYMLKQICPRPLFNIRANVAAPRNIVNKAMQTLLQHNLAEYCINARGFAEYSLKCERVLPLLYYELFLYHIETSFGRTCELIVQGVISNGRMTMSNVIKHVGGKLTDHKNKSTDELFRLFVAVRDDFVKLVNQKFLQRAPAPQPGGKKRIPILAISEKDLYVLPEINLNLLKLSDDETEPPAKKAKIQEKYPDDGIYWIIDYERFRRYLRDNCIARAVSNGVDEKASEIVKAMFELSESKPLCKEQLWQGTTIPVSRHEISAHLKKEKMVDIKELDIYLSVLAEDERNFVTKVNDRSDGMFVVNTKKIMGCLATETAASVIQERFGSKSSRIFRLLLKKKYLEQKQIEEFSMISPKEAKECTYRMMKECFITTQEISKTPEYAPSRTFFLFHVDFNQVCKMITERAYQGAINSIVILEGHKKEQRRLIEKKMRVEFFVAAMEQNGSSPEEIEEISQMITPPEKALLEKVMAINEKVNRTVTDLAEMIFLLKTNEYLSVVAS